MRAAPGRYLAYQAMASSCFFQPVFMVFYQERAGLSLATILWIQTYFTTLRAVLDVPFGALADRTSRRVCLVAGTLAPAGAAALLVWQPTIAVVLVAETLFAIGTALRSGADSALLYDTLKSSGELERYPEAESASQAVIALGSAATAVVGGLLAARDLAWPYVASIAAGVAAAAAAAALPDARRHAAHPHGLMREAVRIAGRTPAVRWAIALAALVVSASHVYYFLQQPYFRAIGLPVAAFGVVFALTKLVTAIVARHAYRFEARLGIVGTAAVMAVVPALGLGAMAAVTGRLGALLILSRGLLDGLWTPLTNVLMNRLVASELRATMLSLQSLVSRLALAGVIALAGVGTTEVGLAATLATSAVVVAACGALLLATVPRLPAVPPVG